MRAGVYVEDDIGRPCLSTHQLENLKLNNYIENQTYIHGCQSVELTSITTHTDKSLDLHQSIVKILKE